MYNQLTWLLCKIGPKQWANCPSVGILSKFGIIHAVESIKKINLITKTSQCRVVISQDI